MTQNFAPTPIGKHLIAGEGVDGPEQARNRPAKGGPDTFLVGSSEHMVGALAASKRAFAGYGGKARAEPAAVLCRIADEIEARGSALAQSGTLETGPWEARLERERRQTIGQLRSFTDPMSGKAFFDLHREEASPDGAPPLRPDLGVRDQPVGPVAVFGAAILPHLCPKNCSEPGQL